MRVLLIIGLAFLLLLFYSWLGWVGIVGGLIGGVIAVCVEYWKGRHTHGTN